MELAFTTHLYLFRHRTHHAHYCQVEASRSHQSVRFRLECAMTYSRRIRWATDSRLVHIQHGHIHDMLRDRAHDREEDNEQNRDANRSSDPNRYCFTRFPPPGPAIERYSSGWLSYHCRIPRRCWHIAFVAAGSGRNRMLVSERSFLVAFSRNLFDNICLAQSRRRSVS